MNSVSSNKGQSAGALQSNVSLKRVQPTGSMSTTPAMGVRSTRFVGIPQQQKQIPQVVHPVKNVSSSVPRQQKLMRQILTVQPAIPQEQQEIGQPVPSAVAQSSVQRHNILQKLREHQIQTPVLSNQHQKVIPGQLPNIPDFSQLLHQLATVVRRKQASNSAKEAANLKGLGKRSPTSIGTQRSRLRIEKMPKAHLSQTKFVGKVRKITSPNVQQRQFMEQTKKYITTYPEDLKFVKKPVTPKPSTKSLVQQISAPVIFKSHSSHHITLCTTPALDSIHNEDMLRCAICTEMFIEAMTLFCSHTFCKFCIAQCRKNRPHCPICKMKISREYPTRIIDNYIEKILENASNEVKEHRRQVIEQRVIAIRNSKKMRVVEFPIGTVSTKRVIS